MFNLIRRVSHGIIPRSDRPWEDDATSNAPRKIRKRRLSSTERDDADDDHAGKKRARGESTTPSVADADATFFSPIPQMDTKEVKEVTRGVNQVYLDGGDPQEEERKEETAAPESIPLPEEKSGELEDLESDAASPKATEVSSPQAEEAKVSGDDAIVSDDASDVASSSGGDDVPSKEDNVKEVEDISSTESKTENVTQPDTTKD